jgi:hypothetical protein
MGGGATVRRVAGATTVVAVALAVAQARQPLWVVEATHVAVPVSALAAEPPLATTIATTPPVTARPVAPTTVRPRPRPQPSKVARAAPRATSAPDEVGAEALTLLNYPWQQRLRVTIEFLGPRAGMRAYSHSFGNGSGLIEAYVRPGDSARLVALSVAHELGHLIDTTYLSDQDRAEWLRIRGRPDVAWWTCDGCTDFNTGSGDFAETFAAWQVGAFDYRSQVAPYPTADEMASLTRYFR